MARLFLFKDEDCLCAWGRDKLQLTDEQAKSFASVKMPRGYASLSLNAINKMLPYLRRGYRNDEAVFLANLKAALPKEVCAEQDVKSVDADNREGIAAKIYWSELFGADFTRSQEGAFATATCTLWFDVEI